MKKRFTLMRTKSELLNLLPGFRGKTALLPGSVGRSVMRVGTCIGYLLLLLVPPSPAHTFHTHGPLPVAKSGTHLEHTDGTPFFVLADTCWTGPALSTEKDWQTYLDDRKKKGFTAVQFNMVSPWRTAPVDGEGNASYTLENGKLKINEAFYKRLDA